MPSSATMTYAANPNHTERTQAMGREARSLEDGELESRLVAAEHALAELRRQLQDAVAWRDALDAESGSPDGPASRCGTVRDNVARGLQLVP